MRKAVQLLIVSRQVYFDTNAETMTLSGKGFSRSELLSSEQFTIEWEFIKPSGKGMVYNVGNKEFLDKILEFTGG